MEGNYGSKMNIECAVRSSQRRASRSSLTAYTAYYAPLAIPRVGCTAEGSGTNSALVPIAPVSEGYFWNVVS
jgi:hypothetical protein